MINRIYLVGMPGAGKTVFGRRLANQLGWQFVDLDEWIVESAGLSIADIFTGSGEAIFRKIEQECLHKTAELNQTVISSGGGTPCHFENMEWMNEHGLTVFLDIPVDVIAGRLLQSGSHAKRPLLAESQNLNSLENKLSNLLISRSPFYLKSKVRLTSPNDAAVMDQVKASGIKNEH